MSWARSRFIYFYKNGWKSAFPELIACGFLSLLSLALACARCSNEESASELVLEDRALVLIFTQTHKVVEVIAEVAQTEEQRRKGLMGRKELGENEGMLFIMPYSGYHTFWMKNTLIPLDMIFIGEDLRIKGIIENARPESTEPLGISEPSRYVLEVNGGFCQKKGVKRDDQVKIFQYEEPE